MLPESITCIFKNKTSFIKLQIKSGCSYYLKAREKNWYFISNFITWNFSNKSIVTHNNIHDLLNAKLKTNIFLRQSMEAFIAFNMFLVLCVCSRSLRKRELWLFLAVKFIGIMLSLIMLVSEILKIQGQSWGSFS